MSSAPVLVGVGVATQRHDNPLDALNPLALMLQATISAGAEAPGLLPRIDRILIPKGRWAYPDPGRHIANGIGATGARSILSTVGVLQQTLIGNACAAIATGEARAALVVGGDAGYRILRAGIAGIELPEPEADGTPDELLAPKEELRHPAELRAGMRMPVGLYAIMESAFRARHGWSIAEHRQRLGALYSRFSAIAADNPHAWTRTPVTPDAIAEPAARNPMQAFPYTKLLCSSWNVDQAAALLFCSAELADELGIPHDRRVYPWASTESNHMVPVTARAELDRCHGARIAGQAALTPFGLDVADLGLIDLYTCFPLAVEAYAAELGIDPARDLSVTGGMSFAGGPYNNYVFQSTARMAELLRQGKGRTGLVSCVSGVLTKQGFGLWSTQPAPEPFRFIDVSAEVARAVAVKPVVMDRTGPGRIAGYTVLHDRSRPPTGVAIVDLTDNSRAVVTSDDPALTETMQQTELCGATVFVDGPSFRLAN